ncbi:tat pathway signal sequence [Colletotrichum orchidophilum]|uniref:Tat pathway signal sequence n=1 Tax=Colletotrichum orchidophilum TaxID=1209926 RepID=A0A1G4BCZ4_9PEZI|nr:tat pathway signal sequence [Colletotrichum orchidophilum]OHE99192.1 tat pathway signal sequence [Colletotrichum orchidophilum]
MAGFLWYRGDEWREVWDYWFKWTDEHLTSDDLRPMIYTYDELGAEALDRLDKVSPPVKPPAPGEKAGAPRDAKVHRDLYALLRDNADADEVLGKLWTEVNTIPPWVDWAQIERGQQVFLRYAGPAIFALTFQSLVGGMGGRRVVETLSRTGGFGVKVTRRRLLETFQHILQVTGDLPSIQPGGDGFASSIRVRLLHAAVRRRILLLAGQRPSYYDVAAYGVPVNDLDSIGTISTFSSTLLWIGLPRQGIFLTDREKEDYLALWRYVAHIMGTPTDAFASVSKARAMMESLLASEIQPSDTSRALANNVLSGLANQPPSHVSREFLAAETYWLNGAKLARALAVERPPLHYSLLILGQCLFFMFMCYSRRLFPSWDESRNKNLQKALFNLTVHKPELGALGKETTFEFKYIPTLDVMSSEAAARSQDRGPLARGPDPDPDPAPTEAAGAGAGARAGISTRRVRSNERRSLIALTVAFTCSGGTFRKSKGPTSETWYTDFDTDGLILIGFWRPGHLDLV